VDLDVERGRAAASRVTGLARKGIVGAWFAGSSTLLISVVQGVKLLAFARLLAPEQHGVFAMAMVVISCCMVLADLGLAGAVIQRDDVPARVLSSLYWLGVAGGIGLALVLAALSPVIGWAFGDPRVAPVVAALGILFVLQPWGALHQALVEKRLAFKRMAAIEVTAAATGAAAAIAAAASGAGVWAFVVDQLVAAAAKTVMLVTRGGSGFRPERAFGLSGLRSYVRFGALSVGQRTANYATANVDYALVGGVLGAGPLGLYRMGYELATLAPGRLNVVASRVFFPVMARLAGDRDRFRTAYLRLQESATLLGLPLVAGIALTAPVFVPHVLGARWAPSVPLLQILAIVGAGRVVAGTIGPALLAAGRPDLGLRWSLLLVALQVPTLLVAVRLGGLAGVAWAFAGLQTLYVVLNYRLLVRRLFGPCLAAYLRSILPAFAMVAAMAAAVLAARHLTAEAPWPATLAVQIAAGAAVYLVLAWRLTPKVLSDLALTARGEATP
jgi:O-antigen/teichoic acid export membrane protein